MYEFLLTSKSDIGDNKDNQKEVQGHLFLSVWHLYWEFWVVGKYWVSESVVFIFQVEFFSQNGNGVLRVWSEPTEMECLV